MVRKQCLWYYLLKCNVATADINDDVAPKTIICLSMPSKINVVGVCGVDGVADLEEVDLGSSASSTIVLVIQISLQLAGSSTHQCRPD